MPLEHQVEFYLQACTVPHAESGIIGWLNRLMKQCDPRNEEESLAKHLLHACKLIITWVIIRGYGASKPGDALIGKVVEAGILLCNEDLCCEALSRITCELPKAEIVKMIECFDWIKSKSM